MLPPIARVESVHEVLYGIRVEDPYRWMEFGGEEFDAWLDGQSRYARQVLDAAPRRPELLSRITALGRGGAQRTRFAFAGGRMFWLRADPGLAVPVLMVDERVLFDPSTTEDDRVGHRHLDWYVPSPDGRLVAVAVSVGGGEMCTVRIVDVDTGALTDDAVRNVRFPFLSWLPDGERFLYHQYRDPAPEEGPAEQRLDSRTRVHRLGTQATDDPVLLARGINPAVPLRPVDRPFVYHPAGSGLLVAVISHRALRGDRVDAELSACTIYVAPATGHVEPGGCPWTSVASTDDEVSAWAVGPDALYLLSTRDAPNGRVLVAPLADPTRRAELVPHSDRVLEAVRVVGDDLLIRDLVGGVHGLRRVPLSGGAPVPVALPGHGTILEWAPAPAGLLLRMESWTRAPTVYRCEPGTGAVTDTGWGARTPTGFDDIEAYRTAAPARDGTPIPVTLIHDRNMSRDEPHPLLLAAYGSYGLSYLPRFIPGMLAWLERGGVWAIAHVRGGGELGRRWHRAGQLLAKENTITDLIDCAEHLIATGYTSPALLAGFGASAGGIPTGGALTRRPDLWGAMVMRVPLVDALRVEHSENGPINVPEFGSVATRDGFDSLRIIDAYRRVTDGVRYPGVLLTTGRNDPRVAPWQPAKITARLQAASASGRPVLLRVEDDGGHGFGTTAEQRDGQLADELAFLLNHLDAVTPS